jgi:glutamate--cysteine ligase
MLDPSPPHRAGVPGWAGAGFRAPSRPALSGRVLTEDAAEACVAESAFDTGVPGFVGVEVEWLLRRTSDPARPVPRNRFATALAVARDGMRHGRLTIQPGGGLKVSSPPSPGIDACVRRTAEDLTAVREALRVAGLAPMNSALDPFRSPRRVLDGPGYEAVERYLDRTGRAGQWVICSTAAVRVHLDAGTGDDGPLGYHRRWGLAHALGPVLVAAFANSPLRLGRITGWRSTRQAIWQQLDPARTAPPPIAPGGDPRAAWARYALDAPVVGARHAGRRWAASEGLTFRQWLRSRRLRPPSLDDLGSHLGTLLPPVRPRGHLELRMIDAQLGGAWLVPVAVTAALFGDAQAGDEAFAATARLHAVNEPFVCGPWARAARAGLRDPVLAGAALTCFMAAYEALGRQNVSRQVRDGVAWFIESYVSRGRSPADDLLDTVDDFV